VTGQVPSVVFAPTFHVHEATPLPSATWGSRPAALDGPDLYWTTIVQFAPGLVLTAAVASELRGAGEVSEVKASARVGAAVALGAAVGVTLGSAVAIGASVGVGSGVGGAIAVGDGVEPSALNGLDVGVAPALRVAMTVATPVWEGRPTLASVPEARTIAKTIAPFCLPDALPHPLRTKFSIRFGTRYWVPQR
jgi:hypothetical protein